MTCLNEYIDRLAENHRATNLFQQAPTIHFRPETENCDKDLKVLKSREKTVITLDIGPFRAKETILQDGNDGIHRSERLRSLVPNRCIFGYDVLVHVGRALFIQGFSEHRIVEELAQKNVPISRREIGYLGGKFIAYLAVAHHQSSLQLKEAMAWRGGYILHLDGTCEADSPHLFTGMDGIARIVLDNIKIPSEKAELLIPFLRRIKRRYGDPLALVHDMGKGILSAVETVFKGVPDFICHFHFLRDIGKDLFEEEYAVVRNRLRKHKIRPLLAKKIKSLEKMMDNDAEAVRALADGIDDGHIDPEAIEKTPAAAAYAMVRWTLDTSELDGYGFPFDCPHIVFHQRLLALLDLINQGLIKNRFFSQLWGPLIRVFEDPQLKKAAKRMQKKTETFKKLRKALAMAVPQGKQGLNDEGKEIAIGTIEEKVKCFREEIETDEEYSKMVEQIDKYWEKLFADPIMVSSPTGPLEIQPQRTNNIMERFFRDLKRGNRKRSGMKSLGKTLRFLLADTPLVKNLENPEYVEILLDGCDTLEERFAKIDSHTVVERVKAERKNQGRIPPEMKKIIQRPDLPQQLTMLLSSRQY